MLQRISGRPKQVRYTFGTTPFPNFLLDRGLPRLTDTEWRLLCVIVRQTVGWSLGGGSRKKADWLSHFQLKQKTGRQSAAISSAIDILVRAGLISVRDGSGRALYTTRARRRSHSHLYFALHPLAESKQFQKHFLRSRFRNSQIENNKRNPDKRKQQHGLQADFSPDEPPF